MAGRGACAAAGGAGGWFLSPLAPGSGGHLHEVFRRGLAEGGYVDGQNVTIDYRLAEGRYDLVAEQAAALVRRQ